MPSIATLFAVPLILLYQLVAVSVAEVCPVNADTVAKLLSATAGTSHRKSCPDFKDDAEQVACCPSAITPGTFYCCTTEKRAELDAEIAAEARRLFFRNHMAHIIIGSIVAFILFIIIASFICKRVSFCPMYLQKSLHAPSSQILSRYRPVDTLPPKPPSVYEAPPPYDFTTARPSHQFLNNQRDHDWNCLIENEINDARIIDRAH
uniref:Uncharacterized protein n=1 Tax=Panagrellus redivivus TaxID=6233 RepID=A0A7E4UYG1_PANRE